jgi:hypothetical protein
VAEYSQYVSIVAAIGITGSTVLANGQFFEQKILCILAARQFLKIHQEEEA